MFQAGLEVHQFWPLVEIHCSPDLKFFLCSMYTPICMENYNKPVPACRKVCRRAMQGCLPLMKQYGFEWPERMACDKLPTSGHGNICMDNKQTDNDEEQAGGVDMTGRNGHHNSINSINSTTIASPALQASL